MTIKIVPKKSESFYMITEEITNVLKNIIREVNPILSENELDKILRNGGSIVIRDVPIDLRRNICAYQFSDDDKEIEKKIRRRFKVNFSEFYNITKEHSDISTHIMQVYSEIFY